MRAQGRGVRRRPHARDARLFDSSKRRSPTAPIVLATTARAHDQAKPVVGAGRGGAPDGAARRGGRDASASCSGASAYGLENEEVALADEIVTCRSIPPSPRSISRRRCWSSPTSGSSSSSGGALPFRMPEKSPPAPQAATPRILRHARARAREGRVFPPAGKARHHADQSAQHLPPHAADPAGHPDLARRHHGDRRGPQGAGARRRARRRGGGDAAHAAGRAWQGRAPAERGPVRGLARLLRRNPTEAERMLWDALVNDRRFAGEGFKRQVPVGAAHHRLRVVPAAHGDRSDARRRERSGRAKRAPTNAPGSTSEAIGSSR